MEWYWILLILIVIIGIIVIILVAVFASPVSITNNDVVIASGKTLTVDNISATTTNANLTLEGNGTGGVNIVPLTTFSTGLKLPSSGATGSTLNFNSIGSFVVTYSGGGTGTATWQYSRIGNSVTVNIPKVSLVFNTATTINVTGYPSFLYPSSIPMNCDIIVFDNAITQTLSGKLFIPSKSGTLNIFKTFNNDIFNGPANIGHDFCSFDYNVN